MMRCELRPPDQSLSCCIDPGEVIIVNARKPIQIRPLTGGWLRGYTILWIALAIFLMPLAIVHEISRYDGTPRTNAIEIGLGANIMQTSLGLDVFQVGTDEAVAAGIVQDDVITHFNGVPLTGLEYGEMMDALERTPKGQAVALRLVSEDGVEKEAQLLRSDANSVTTLGGVFTLPVFRMILITLNFLGQIGFMILAIVLFRRRQEIVPQVMALGFLMVTLFPAEAFFRDSLPAFAGAIPDIVPGSLTILGLLLFPEGQFRNRLSVGFAIFAVAALALNGLVISDFAPGASQLVFIAIMALVVLQIGIKYRGSADDETRQQFRWVFLGFAGMVLFIAISEVIGEIGYFVAAAAPGPHYNWLSALTLIVAPVFENSAPLSLALGLLIALLRYRLYDADVVIGRTTTYVLTTVFLGLGFFVTERAINFAGRAYLGDDLGAISYGIAAALAAVSLGPIHAAMVRWSDRRFQKQLVSLRDDLPETARDMRHSATRDDLLKTALERVVPAVYAKGAAVLNSDASGVLHAQGLAHDEVEDWASNWTPEVGVKGFAIDKSDPFLPFRMPLRAADEESEIVGWLVVTMRLDGSMINRDERIVLTGLADPLARAMTIIEERVKAGEETRDRIETLSDRLATIEVLLKQTLQSGSVRSGFKPAE